MVVLAANEFLIAKGEASATQAVWRVWIFNRLVTLVGPNFPRWKVRGLATVDSQLLTCDFWRGWRCRWRRYFFARGPVGSRLRLTPLAREGCTAEMWPRSRCTPHQSHSDPNAHLNFLTDPHWNEGKVGASDRCAKRFPRIRAPRRPLWSRIGRSF